MVKLEYMDDKDLDFDENPWKYPPEDFKFFTVAGARWNSKPPKDWLAKRYAYLEEKYGK